MRTGFSKRLLSLFLAICMVLSTFTVTAFAASGNWKPADNTKIYVLTDNLSKEQISTLKYEANLFKAELDEKKLGKFNVTFGSEAYVGEKDVVLTFQTGISPQGFVITVDGSRLTVAASDDDGIFYGWRSVIKQMLINGSVTDTAETPSVLERSISLDNGRKYYSVEWIKELIREMSWSNMNTLVLHFSEEMGLGLETKLYSWLNGRDGTLCTQVELAADYDNRYLTQEEFLEIAAYAKKYHVDLMPSLDSPGHLNYLVKTFNDKVAEEGSFSFTYNGKTYKTTYSGNTYNFYVDGVSQGSSTYGIGNYFKYNGKTTLVKGSRNANYSRGIDISNPVAVAFVQSLTVEYGELFRSVGATKIDIGGDELLGWGAAVTSSVAKWKQLDHWKAYAQNRAKAEGKSNYSSAVAYDAFLYYMNDLNDLARRLGYTGVRMWNDDALRTSDTGWKKVVELDQDIDIWFWTLGDNSCWTYAVAGYQLYNILSDYTYYAMTSDYFGSRANGFKKAYADLIYNEWSPYLYDPTNTTLGTGKNMAVGNANTLGGALGIWSDNPKLRTEAQVMADIKPLFRAIGAKSWNATANSSVPYKTYSANLTKMGDAPAVDLSAINDTVVDPAPLRAAIQKADAVDGSGYSAVSYQALVEASDAAKVILDRGAASQAEQNQAIAAINNAYASLVALDYTELLAALELENTVDPNGYNEDSYAAFTEAIANGRAVLNSPDATQATIDAATAAILAAKKALVTDTGALEKAVADAEKIEAGMYTDASYSAYLEAVEAGRAVLAKGNASPEEVLAAYQAIADAKAKLTADKSALQALVDSTPSLDTVNTALYTEFALNEYKTSLANAQAVLANSLATQEEVDDALAAFAYARGYIFVDYSELEALVAQADEVEANKDLYMPAFYEDYMNIVNEAKTKYLAEGAYRFHQSSVDAMADTIRANYVNLTTLYTIEAMTRELKALVAEYETVYLPKHQNDPYSLESWISYRAAIAGAERILTLEYFEYADVDKCVANIKSARGLLNNPLFTKSESEASLKRKHDMINSAGFQVKSAYAGSTVRVAVSTNRAYDVLGVIVLDEDGVACKNVRITPAPVNRRRPNEKILYVDIVLDGAPGLHTYTVYVSDRTPEEPMFYLCGDPAQCSITIK